MNQLTDRIVSLVRNTEFGASDLAHGVGTYSACQVLGVTVTLGCEDPIYRGFRPLFKPHREGIRPGECDEASLQEWFDSVATLLLLFATMDEADLSICLAELRAFS